MKNYFSSESLINLLNCCVLEFWGKKGERMRQTIQEATQLFPQNCSVCFILNIVYASLDVTEACTSATLLPKQHIKWFCHDKLIPYLGWYDSVVCKLLRDIMAMLGKTVCYINSSCVALMRWVKTLEHKIKKEVIKKLSLLTAVL